MKALLSAMQIEIEMFLPYLTWVGVIDDEQLPPDGPQPPFLGLKDGGIVPTSLPGKKDLESLTVYVVVYQALIDHENGASIMGREEYLGDAATGLLDLHAELRQLLNDNFLGLPLIHYAHRDRLDASRTLANSEDGRLIQVQRATYTYRRYIS